MGSGEIVLPEIRATLRGVSLCHRDGEFFAFAPRPDKGGFGIQWDCNSPWAKSVAAEMAEMFKRMGGDMPPTTPEKAENRANGRRRIDEKRKQDDVPRDHVTGKPIGTDPFDGEPGEIERRVVPFDLVSIDGNQVGEDDAEGLHRVLGVDAVSETCARAGL
ncbi:hypothetical protein LCM4577_11115 [Mesorhizobium sp. LCM 4577]|nr:hypothetical protein LCM4577_11115 [Mesorhizobium sp. LCM 4577]